MPKSFSVALLFVTVLVLTAGCGNGDDQSNTVDSYLIEASDFEQSCQSDDECMLVVAGEYCGCVYGCPNAAINVSEKDAYEEAQQEASRRCPETNVRCTAQRTTEATGQMICVQATARCVQGTCELVEDHVSGDAGVEDGDADAGDAGQ